MSQKNAIVRTITALKTILITPNGTESSEGASRPPSAMAWLFSESKIAWSVGFHPTAPSELDHLLTEVQTIDQGGGFRQRSQVDLEMLLPGDAVAIGGELVLG